MNDVAWATTWEETANLYLPKLLGIPELPMAISHAEGDNSKMSMTPPGWKAYGVAVRHRNRHLVWVDDSAGTWVRSWSGRNPAQTLVVVPDERNGLTAAQMDQVDAFADRFL